MILYNYGNKKSILKMGSEILLLSDFKEINKQ